jgi:hypothetical protein
MILLTYLIAHSVVRMVITSESPFTYNCTFFLFFGDISVGLSAYSVAVLSIQRYNVTVNSFHVHVFSQQTWRGTVATICGVWIVAALFSVPSALLELNCFGLPMDLRNMAYYKRVIIFKIFVFCLLPLFLTAFSYIMTARHLLKSANPISEETQNSQLNTRITAAKVVLGLTLVFVIGYVPLNAVGVYVIFYTDPYVYLAHLSDLDNMSFNVLITAMSLILLYFMNFSLNPVALFCTSLAFRKHLKRYLCCCCKTNFPPIDIELTKRS